ncbi:hypothetical protein BS47DRAFT_1487205 [Hydnum rufescens UP504]|uniref:Prefoldin subunit 5 n=1 Tax=Hydnum rufescens UP504 TaxID=1448309 RepID=A0A9P6DUR0_9AGAM|nr:hypothetical protein BS47DRAFT_1487205 [Hydnum rufescens UP504]
MSVNVQDLDLPQLTEVKRQLDEELGHLTNSFAQLKQAQAKFKACVENVAEINPSNTGKVILVPLTNSLYVPGRLSNPDTVIVDVGTGYYVKKERAAAVKHYQAKMDFVRSNLETLQETIQKKQENLSFLIQVMQAKMQQ